MGWFASWAQSGAKTSRGPGFSVMPPHFFRFSLRFNRAAESLPGCGNRWFFDVLVWVMPRTYRVPRHPSSNFLIFFDFFSGPTGHLNLIFFKKLRCRASDSNFFNKIISPRVAGEVFLFLFLYLRDSVSIYKEEGVWGRNTFNSWNPCRTRDYKDP